MEKKVDSKALSEYKHILKKNLNGI